MGRNSGCNARLSQPNQPNQRHVMRAEKYHFQGGGGINIIFGPKYRHLSVIFLFYPSPLLVDQSQPAGSDSPRGPVSRWSCSANWLRLTLRTGQIAADHSQPGAFHSPCVLSSLWPGERRDSLSCPQSLLPAPCSLSEPDTKITFNNSWSLHASGNTVGLNLCKGKQGSGEGGYIENKLLTQSLSGKKWAHPPLMYPGQYLKINYFLRILMGVKKSFIRHQAPRMCLIVNNINLQKVFSRSIKIFFEKFTIFSSLGAPSLEKNTARPETCLLS